MGGIWEDIAAARYAEDRLWHPSLSLDLLARDWAGVTVPLCVRHTATGYVSVADGVWNDWFTMQLFLLPDWNGDATYDDMQIHISVDIDCNHIVTGAQDGWARIEDGTAVLIPPIGSPGFITLTRNYANADWQSGKLELQFQHWGGSASTANVRTNAIDESDGPRAFYQVRQV